ncbi:transposase family protein [Ktedonobacter sp. SOSP1-85]|uniref:transposase family protein n=1 Tax=Ktedonobacter sp. SOSP1-85 TaxID=2778367 RepID=UPI0035AE9F7E
MKVPMNSLASILFPNSPNVVIEEITREGNVLIFSIRSTKRAVPCPVCASPSTRLHGSYVRKPADLPCLEYTVRLHLRVRRFLCQKPTCQRQTFALAIPRSSRGSLTANHPPNEAAACVGFCLRWQACIPCG